MLQLSFTTSVSMMASNMKKYDTNEGRYDNMGVLEN